MLRRPSLLFGVSCRGTRRGVFFFAWYLSVSFVTNRIFNMRLKNAAGGAWGLFVASTWHHRHAFHERKVRENMRRGKPEMAEMAEMAEMDGISNVPTTPGSHTRSSPHSGSSMSPSASVPGVPSPGPPSPPGPPGLDGSRNDRRLRRMSSWLRKRLWKGRS